MIVPRLRIDGVPPSKKNGQMIIVNPRTHRPLVIPKKEYRLWEGEAAFEFHRQTRACAGFRGPITAAVAVTLVFFVSDRRAWDLSNKLESVNDALVKAGVLEDDNRFIVRDLRVTWRPCEKGQDHAAIIIKPYTEDPNEFTLC